MWDRWSQGDTNPNPADCLADNDSYAFWEAVGGHLKPGHTGTNVMDVQILVLRRRAGPNTVLNQALQ